MYDDPQIIGLFEGFGGLTMSVQDVVGGELIAYAEVEPAACRVLEHHNPGTPNLGDVTAIDWSQVYVDARRALILTGGFPCTDVSSAGRRLGLHPGTRSGLWQHMSYAIAQLRPDLVVIENVRGLLTARGAEPTAELLAAWAARDKWTRVLGLIESKLRRARREGNMPYVHRHERDRARILGRRGAAVAAAKRVDAVIVRAVAVVLGDLADLGYDARWYGLRAADVGAPHARFRIFIVAWPAADAGGGQLQRWRVGPVVAGPQGAGAGQGPERERDRDAAGDGDKDAADTDVIGRESRAECHGGTEAGQSAPLGGDAARRVLDWGDYEPAIRRWEHITGRAAPAPTGRGARGGQQLSPVFVEWMMGLPAGHVTGVLGLSRTEQLKMLGNGVVPQQAAAAIAYLLEAEAAWAAA